MIVTVLAVVIVAAQVVGWVLDRYRRHLERKLAALRAAAVVDECECGAKLTGADRHLVVDGGDFSDLGESMQGGWFMAAPFCAEHCPGGCRRGCPVVVP